MGEGCQEQPACARRLETTAGLPSVKLGKPMKARRYHPPFRHRRRRVPVPPPDRQQSRMTKKGTVRSLMQTLCDLQHVGSQLDIWNIAGSTRAPPLRSKYEVQAGWERAWCGHSTGSVQPIRVCNMSRSRSPGDKRARLREQIERFVDVHKLDDK
eukprot:6455348-Amphidinium_carterae.1